MFNIILLLRKKLLFTITNIDYFYSSGGHVGHRINEWRPTSVGINNFLFIHSRFLIFNLPYIMLFIHNALFVVKQMSLRGASVLYVESTKQLLINTFKITNNYFGISYIYNFWINGTLTNFKETVFKLLKKKTKCRNKKLQLYSRGLANLDFIPEFVISMSEFHSPFVIREANRLVIPTISVIDSNIQVIESTYPIILNDDSIPALRYLFFVLSSSYWFGRSDFVTRYLCLSFNFVFSLLKIKKIVQVEILTKTDLWLHKLSHDFRNTTIY